MSALKKILMVDDDADLREALADAGLAGAHQPDEDQRPGQTRRAGRGQGCGSLDHANCCAGPGKVWS